MKRLRIAPVPLLALFLAGCAGVVGSNSPTPPAGQLTVSPTSATVRGLGTQQFAASTNNGTSPALAWSVNGVAGGNASTGTISAAGLYTAPEFPPANNAVTIAVTETADTSKTASSAVTLENPVPTISTVNPTSIPVGAFTLTINGSHFASGATVDFGSATLTTTRVSSTQLTATGTATSSQVGSIAIKVTNPNPGSVTSGSTTAQVVTSSPITVAVSPATTVIPAGDSVYFTASVTGTSNTQVTWAVNGVTGGNGTIGYIDQNGHYIAPFPLPSPNLVTITATSVADTSKSGSSSATLVNPLPVLTSVSPTNIGVGAFLITVTGSGFIKGSVINFGGQALPTVYVSGTELDATGTALASQVGNVPVTVSNPSPGASTSKVVNVTVVNGGAALPASSAVRFLEQASFGPTPEMVNQVQQTGFDTYLQNQFAASASTYPDPLSTDTELSKVQKQFFVNALNNPDQLRQRVAFALNELWVVSGNKVNDPTGYTNYMRALTNDALGNYYNVMKDVTLTPAMGHFLDMVNNDKPGTGQHANENYARELMQLFTLGLNQLNPDGTPILDATGNPIPTYTQDDVMALGRSFTGWTYPTQPGQTLQKHNPSYYGGPMVPYESNHDAGAKTFLGQSVAAGQSAEQELDSVLTIIFNHPNLPPFVARQLIEKLVTSNPSAAYISRVAAAFSSGKYNSYGSGKRGDMQATLAAILEDTEARRGDSSTTADPNDGKLREPIVMMVSVARAFHAVSDGTGFTGWGGNMSQTLFNSPSVFNFFPPNALIPQTTLQGPEFAIFNTSTSFARINFINAVVYGQISGATTLDFTLVVNAGTPDQMCDWLNTIFLHGTMSSSMRQSILTAVNAASTTNTKIQAQTAIYLVTSSSQYQVQR